MRAVGIRAAGIRAVGLLLAALGLSLVFTAAARADVWGYLDDKGVAHFASEKLDERYELFYRGGEGFDTANGVGTPRAVAVPTSGASRLLAYFEISPGFKRVQHHLREASRKHDVDYELLKALIATESGFDASAVSPKGAVGLMQVLPSTAQRYGLKADSGQPLERKLADPAVNIRTGTRYLRHLIDLYPGRLELALAAYNAGEGAVQKAGNRIPNFRETQNYVRTVMQLYAMLKPPAAVTAARAPALAGRGNIPTRVRMELTGAPVGVAASVAPQGDSVTE